MCAVKIKEIGLAHSTAIETCNKENTALKQKYPKRWEGLRRFLETKNGTDNGKKPKLDQGYSAIQFGMFGTGMLVLGVALGGVIVAYLRGRSQNGHDDNDSVVDSKNEEKQNIDLMNKHVNNDRYIST